MVARASRQDKLFDVAPQFSAKSIGAARVAFGGAAEEIVCAVLGLDRIKIDGHCAVNFDAERAGVFYEIKSLKARSGKIPAYKWRLQKKSDFPNLMYAILIHNISGVRTDIMRAMLEDSKILVCRASLIRELAAGESLNIPKKKPEHSKRFGYTREGYIDGYYNVPVSKILKHTIARFEISVELYGMKRKIELLIA